MADVLNYPRGGGKTAKMYEVIGIAEAKRLGIISDRLAHDIRMSKAGFLFRIENGKEYKVVASWYDDNDLSKELSKEFMRDRPNILDGHFPSDTYIVNIHEEWVHVDGQSMPLTDFLLKNSDSICLPNGVLALPNKILYHCTRMMSRMGSTGMRLNSHERTKPERKTLREAINGFYKVNRIQPKESESKMLVHKTKEGKHILIGQMDDDHLFNYVNLVIKASLEIKGISTDSMTPFQRVMLGMPEVRQEDSAEQVRLHIVKLYPYFTEMILRDHPKLSKVSKMLQSLMERKDAVPSKLLPKNIIGPGAQETQIDEIEELVEVEVIED